MVLLSNSFVKSAIFGGSLTSRLRRRIGLIGREKSTLTASGQGGGQGQEITVWNSILRRTVPLQPQTHRPKILTWYACGPTVYDSAHIGHASSYIRQDVIRRILEGLDGRLSVIQLMGVTDIDDKIIKKANELQVPYDHISRQFELEFFQDLGNLDVKPPTIKARVTDFIPQIIQFVGKLIENESAYVVPDGSVYFDVEKYGEYGKLQKISETHADDEEGDGKKSRKDFAVWKGWKAGEPFWETPWGKGRPGWHIECSVMASHYFGTKLDIHSGGRDLKFPHHENEEAQCCSRFQVENWVSHWIHTGLLNFSGDVKMSKSLGNTVSIGKFLEENSPKVLRMFCILTKYSHSLEYSPESLLHAKSLLNKFDSFLSSLEAILQGNKLVCQSQSTSIKSDSSHSDSDMWSLLIKSQDQVYASLANDFDTPSAIHCISEFIDGFNRMLQVKSDSSSLDMTLVLASLKFVKDFLELVGLSGDKAWGMGNQDSRLQDVLSECIEFREKVRYHALAFDEEDKKIQKQKRQERKELLETCDDMRKRLQPMGIEIKDHGKSSSWAMKS